MHRSHLVMILAILLMNRCGSKDENHARADCASCHIRNFFSQDPIAGSFSNGHHPVNMDYYKGIEGALSARECGKCHTREYETWKKSKHAKAWNNPSFEMALAVEPYRWCVNCHAPLSIQALPSDGRGMVGLSSSGSELRDEGINCAACHVRDGVIYASRAPSESARRRSIHTIDVSPDLREGSLCKGCHEFNFPLEFHSEIPYRSTPMQSTHSEFAAIYGDTPAGGERCQSCHLTGIGKGDHTFQGKRELLQEKNRLRFSFRRHLSTETGAEFLVVNVRLKDAGHCFPTGDLFRSVDITVRDGSGHEAGFFTVAKRVDLKTYETVSDTRLCPGPGKRDIDSDIYIELTGSPVSCRIVYHDQGLIDVRIRDKIALFINDDSRIVRLLFPDFEGSVPTTGSIAERAKRIHESYFTTTLYSGPCN